MKKIFIIGLLTSTLFYGCTLSIGGGCKCSGECDKPQTIEIINQPPASTDAHCESAEEPIDTLEQY